MTTSEPQFEQWARATLLVKTNELNEAEFAVAQAGLGRPSGTVSSRTRRDGGSTWRDECPLDSEEEAEQVWAWVVKEVAHVINRDGPPKGCVAEVWIGLNVDAQRGFGLSAGDLLILAGRNVDLVFDLYSSP